MDDLFFYGLNRIQEIIGDMDKITKEKIRENLRVMNMGYNLQRQAAGEARGFGEYMLKKYKALKEQIKSSETSNEQQPKTNN